MTLARARLLLVALAGLAPLALPSQAAATFKGSLGQEAYLGASHELMVDDPTGPAPPRALDQAAPASGETPGQEGPSAPVWSPDGTKILYTKLVPDGGDPSGTTEHAAVFVIDEDGTGSREITFPPDQIPANSTTGDGKVTYEDFSPSWSPDGTTIAFVRYIDVTGGSVPSGVEGGADIWTVPVGGESDATPASRLTHDGTVVSALWSPAGDKIAAGWDGDPANGTQLVYTHPTGADAGSLFLVDPNLAGNIQDYDWRYDGQELTVGYATSGATRSAELRTASRAVRVQARTTSLGVAATVSGSTVQPPPVARFSPDGVDELDGGCATVGGQQRCGITLRRLDDPGHDVTAADKQPRYFAPASDLAPGTDRQMLDFQSQQLPIIFLPGFLGSEIQCNGSPTWPRVPIDFGDMDLQADGITNATCPNAGPTGNPVMSISVAGQVTHVYDSITDWVDQNFPDRGTVMGWDWRKTPMQTAGILDQRITQMLNEPLQKAEGATRVVLMGHSYGGLLIRTYLQQHPQRVARALTIGTPFWGSPKALFPLAFGAEKPGAITGWDLGLDLISSSSALQTFAKNLAGDYQLFPSDDFGPYLSLNHVQQAQAGVQAEVGRLGGNTLLLQQAWSNHRTVYDGFFTNGGAVDVRAVVGTGKPTWVGYDFSPWYLGLTEVTAHYGDGDATVPSLSAHQGPLDATPLGDSVHIQYLCGIEHMDETADGLLQDGYKEWADTGRAPKNLDVKCPADGSIEEFRSLKLGVSPGARSLAADRDLSALTNADVLGRLSNSGTATVDELPAQTYITTDVHDPTTFDLNVDGAMLELRTVHDGRQGTPQYYGPLTGTMTISQSTDPAQPAGVELDGDPIAPSPTPPAGWEPPPSGGGGVGAPPPSSTPPSSSATVSTASLKLSVSARAARLKRALRSGLKAGFACSRACRLTAQLRVARRTARHLHVPYGRGGVVASGRASLARAGSAFVTLRFTRKAKLKLGRARKLKLALVATAHDAAHEVATARLALTLRR